MYSDNNSKQIQTIEQEQNSYVISYRNEEELIIEIDFNKTIKHKVNIITIGDHLNGFDL